VSGAIALVSLVVRDYDEALAFFTRALRFRLVEDTPLADGRRWVVVASSSRRSRARSRTAPSPC
jgi:catechol 2,3-dioxygenase-like lactoylglutathione lyase family enzyme